MLSCALSVTRAMADSVAGSVLAPSEQLNYRGEGNSRGRVNPLTVYLAVLDRWDLSKHSSLSVTCTPGIWISLIFNLTLTDTFHKFDACRSFTPASPMNALLKCSFWTRLLTIQTSSSTSTSTSSSTSSFFPSPSSTSNSLSPSNDNNATANLDGKRCYPMDYLIALIMNSNHLNGTDYDLDACIMIWQEHLARISSALTSFFISNAINATLFTERYSGGKLPCERMEEIRHALYGCLSWELLLSLLHTWIRYSDVILRWYYDVTSCKTICMADSLNHSCNHLFSSYSPFLLLPYPLTLPPSYPFSLLPSFPHSDASPSLSQLCMRIQSSATFALTGSVLSLLSHCISAGTAWCTESPPGDRIAGRWWCCVGS